MDMNKQGPVIIIEDDTDDQELLTSVFKELGNQNQLIFFDDGISAYKYLTTVHNQPFLILSDINLPKLGGFELREKIHNNDQLRLKCIPYLFFTTSGDQKHVIAAYSKSVQGFFVKPNSYAELLRVMKNIMEYWKDCQSPDIIV